MSGLSAWLSPIARRDLPASVVVFLVALPLCLGIAVASGASPLAGLVAGIVGGLVVGSLSGSPLAVSGPAAGLTAIVLAGIERVGYEGLLLATVLAGAMQLALGAARAGVFAYYFPSSVIKGMLAAIGIILILKQLPHAVGWDSDYEGDFSFLQLDHRNTFTELGAALTHVHAGALLVSLLGLVLLVGLGRSELSKRMSWLPPAVIVVVVGAVLALLLPEMAPSMTFGSELLVDLPLGGPSAILQGLATPDFARLGDAAVWELGFTLAAVASIETLLCLEAIDKLDPDKRVTSANRELIAQGFGNAVSGLLGGLPVTAVIVRGATNVQSGAQSKASAILHGLWLLTAVIVLASAINLIPLAALAAILLHVGYKLTPLALYRKMFARAPEQWVPFIVTIVAIVFTDLLKGVGIGLAVALFFILLTNLRTPFFVHSREASNEHDGRLHITLHLSENVSFLNKASVRRVLADMPANCIVEIDGAASHYIHPDVLELIEEFKETASLRGIEARVDLCPEATGDTTKPQAPNDCQRPSMRRSWGMNRAL